MDHCKNAAYTLFSKLRKAEGRVDKEGWVSADDIEDKTVKI